MVTVIPTKEELTTPVENGVTGGSSCDTERPFQFIKDYQEVDFHRTSSCKTLPDDLYETMDGQILKSSIQGTFYLQIDGIEPYIQLNNNQNTFDHIILTLTDGIQTVKAITNDSIHNLTFNTKIGSKLLLTDIIPIQNNLLQLTHDNTKFQYGSNRFPRPRANNRNRASGVNRPTYEGRRNSRYDNEDGENNFFKRPPPKNTLMDFMTTLKISNDNNENEKPVKRQSNGNTDQIVLQQEEIDEKLNPEDDPTHANYRERRNPLPPRLQRKQEERTRRNTNHYYDETISSGNDLNSIHHNDAFTNPSWSSTSTSYLGHIEQPTYAYTQSMNGSSATHLNYIPGNPNSLTFISTSPYHNQQTFIPSSYTNEQYNYIPYATNSAYLPTNYNNNNNDTKTISDNDENNDSGIKSETSSNEQKSTSPPSGNDSEKRRDSNSRPRWKINDLCLARWFEDKEFYYAMIVRIHPPYCTVLFNGYDTYDEVHFSDLKQIPRDQQQQQQQQFYSFIPPLSTDINLLTANPYFQPSTCYYPSTIDGCLIMPEAPPFPFNSAGTLYMYPTHTNGYQQNDIEDLTINSTSSPSKDSNDTSTSNDENSFPQPSSVADAPLILVTSDNINNNEQQITTTTTQAEEEIRE